MCGSGLVEPTYWAHRGPGCRTVDLRCPECGTELTLTLDDDEAHAYNVLLYDAADGLAATVRRLAEEWSSDVAGEDERFVRALRTDRILPIDF